MNPVFFSKKIPSVKTVFLSSSDLNVKSIAQSFPKSLRSHKSGNFQKQTYNLNLTSMSSHFKQALVICDKRFQSSLLLKKWRANPKLLFYYVKSGEKTKSLEQLPQHIQKVNSLISDFDKKSVLFIALGGGSLIDLTGFLASIYKRGLPVVFIPSTWLSALDSAHGGKNALNFKNVKNLLGTYHFPKAVFIVEELLKQNPNTLEQQAYGELLKMAFIKGGSFYKNLQQSVLNFKSRDYSRKSSHSLQPVQSSSKRQNSRASGNLKKNFQHSNQVNLNQTVSIQQFLRATIESKIEIVKKDPFEIKGRRKKLNLGHTVGHVLEAVESLPHGIAILHGLLFSLNWSYHKGLLNKKNFEEMKSLILLNRFELNFTSSSGDSCFRRNDGISERQWARNLNRIGAKDKKISLKLFKHYLRQDKKHKAGFKIDFIFIKKPGQVFARSVLEKDLIQEAKRQSLL